MNVHLFDDARFIARVNKKKNRLPVRNTDGYVVSKDLRIPPPSDPELRIRIEKKCPCLLPTTVNRRRFLRWSVRV
jgi:hypothetical protein